MKRSASKICSAVSRVPNLISFNSYHAQQGELPELSYDEHHQEVRDFCSAPGPKPLPVIGNIWRYLPVIGEFDPCRQHVNYEKMHHRYGNIVREVVVGSRIVAHLFDPQDMETLYRNEGRYPCRLSHRALLKYRLERQDTYNGGGLFPSNGKEWHRLRQSFQKHMLVAGAITPYVPTLHDLCNDMITIITRNRNSKDEIEDFQQDLYKWATECTGIITLNRRLGCIGKGLASEEEIKGLVKAAADTHQAVMITENGLPLWQMYPTAAYRSLVAAQDFMAKTIKRHLRIGERSEKGETLVEKFMATPNIDEKDVFGMVLDMFLAGIDTTAYSAAFTLYHLARNPNCQDKLLRELKEALPHKSSEITYNSLNSMSYLKACVKESMRLNPIAIGTGRVLPKDLIISNYRLPAKTIVIAHHQVACRQSQHFSDPLSFRPERWLRNDLSGSSNPFLVLPFGYGPRMCIGRRFAEVELYLLLAKVFRNFRVEYSGGDMDCFTRLINVPDKPIKLKFADL